jgi:cation diffusion facilitator family transporter
MAAPSSKAVVFAALAVNTAIAVTKFAAALFTGSSAMLSEGIHSLVDTGNQGLILVGMTRARRRPDARHPFGYGTEIYFWAFVVAILIFAVGAGVSLYEGVVKLREPHPVTDAYVNYIVLAAAFVLEGGGWLVAWQAFKARRRGRGRGVLADIRASKDPTVFTVLLEDSAAMLGIIVAAVGIALADILGEPWIDGAASIGIGVILGGIALLLAVETKGLLIGEAASPQVVRGIRKIVRETEGVLQINELLTVHFGPSDILVTVSVDFADAFDSRDVELAVTAMERAIKDAYPRVTRVFIEAQSKRDTKVAAAKKG